MNISIIPPEEMIDGAVSLPLSKSISNRLLIINSMTEGAAPLPVIADCDDSRALSQAIADVKAGKTEVNIGAAGTAMRFITAWIASLGTGKTVTVDGSERMRNRPVKVLVDALRSLGADIEYVGTDGFPPLRITPRTLTGGEIHVDASISSQYISALMMIAPAMHKPLVIRLDGETASRPYILMTAALMERFGVTPDVEPYTVTVPNNPYTPGDVSIEHDWSAAAFWYELAAISAGFITLRDLKLPSIQGDSRCATLFEMLGVMTQDASECDDDDDDDEDSGEPVEGLLVSPSPEQFSRFEVDLAENPDLAQALAVTAAALGVPFHLRGLSTLKIKETDRLAAMQTELDKLGLIVEIRNDSELVWNGERHPVTELPRIATYNDHRMAMAFAPLAVFVPGIEILDADVVAKSYPDFWRELASLGFTLIDADKARENADNQNDNPDE